VDSLRIEVTDEDIRVAKRRWIAARDAVDVSVDRTAQLFDDYRRLVSAQAQQIADDFRRARTS